MEREGTDGGSSKCTSLPMLTSFVPGDVTKGAMVGDGMILR
jgi:hypothetical protein